MYRKNGHDHDYEISDQRDKEIIWQYCDTNNFWRTF